MRQVMIEAGDRFAVVEADTPRLQADDEILIRTAACGICSGDLMTWYLAKKVGTVLGHEVAGWAVDVGPDVKHVQPGDLVFLHHHAPCLACADCARGAFVHCSTWRKSKLDPGGMAELIRVPGINARNDSFAVSDLSVEQAIFIEPLACSVKALRRALQFCKATDPSIVVIGCGVMGLLNLATARALGINRLTAIEPDEPRRRKALEFGAQETYSPRDSKDLAADIVIIGPGTSSVMAQGLGYVRPGGVAVLFTPTPVGVQTPLDLGDLYFREISLVPSYSCGPEDTRQAYELLRLKRVCPEPLVTHRFGVEDIQKAYDAARTGGAVLKVLINFALEGPA